MSTVLMRFRGGDVEDYKAAGRRAKKGLSMIMDGIEDKDMDMIVRGAEKAYSGVKEMCDISDDMEEQYGERRNSRHDGEWDESEHDWNVHDDDRLQKRMHNMRKRYR